MRRSGPDHLRIETRADSHGILNLDPFPDMVHECLLEGMVLALERRFEPFSLGRGVNA